MQHFDTIIAGGGIAGIGCARKLAEYSKEFLLITKEVGGRIRASQDGAVNYGAVWVCTHYRHVLPLVSLGRKIRPQDGAIYENGQRQSIGSILIRHPLQTIRIFLLTLRFYFEYARFKRRCEMTSQINAIRGNRYICSLYTQSVREFMQQHHIEDLVQKILSKGIRGIYATTLDEESAFNLMRLCLGLFVSAYEFRFKTKEVVAPFASSAVYDEITALDYSNEAYIVSTRSGKQFSADRVVLATPLAVTEQLLRMHAGKHGRTMHVFHVHGSIYPAYTSGVFKTFEETASVEGIYTQADGTHLVYSTRNNPDLRGFFNSFSVIAHVAWNPIYPNIGKNIIESNPQKGLFIIGDCNIPGLEDAYITGLYAANQILRS